MASVVGICNRALQLLGATPIADILEASRNARACNTAYEPCRDAELRAHPWNFAKVRARLAADATAPTFGRTNAFTLPANCVRLLPPYPEMNASWRDWIVEGGKILTNDAAPLDVRHIDKVSDPNLMDALFREAVSARMARDMCEQITQSNTKRQLADIAYKEAIAEARRTNAFENVPQEVPQDSWIDARA